MADPDDLEERWASLPAPAGVLIEAERVSTWPGGAILLGVDAETHRHLLVQLPSESDRQRIRPLAGLVVTQRFMRIRGDEGIWIDLELTDAQGTRAFTALCVDLLESLASTEQPDLQAVTSVVERWRRFWQPLHDALSPEKQLGLAGELWFLNEWIGGTSARSVGAWQGPLGGRHDFVTRNVSVEVKTTGIATGPVVHRIASLDQLADPVSGRLYLYSLRVIADPLGDQTLDNIVADVRGRANEAGRAVADELDARLSAYGWSPADVGRYERRLRVANQGLYLVEKTFPRLLATSLASGALPVGVLDVSYYLDMAACEPWLIARRADEKAAVDALAAMAD